MRVLQSWLREFCPNNEKPYKLAELLTEQGMECERFIEFRTVLINHIPVEVLSIDETEDFKTVKVKTDLGLLQLKTKATDIAIGDVVAADLEQKYIPTLEDLGINNLRCALQIPPEYGWDYVIDDVLFEFSTLSNRGDQLSVLGIAREATYCTNSQLQMPPVADYTPTPNTPDTHKFTIELAAPDLCSRYVGLSFNNISISRSPAWMRYRLSTCGIRPVNNIVDITNYVLWELGQPLHAFDRDNLKGNKIIVRRAKNDETFIAINHNEYKLNNNHLAICDEETIRALAGVMGGLNSEVTENTKNLFLESAWFLPANNRKTAKSLGLISDSSLRFSRGVDPLGTLRGALRFAYLVEKLNCGEVLPHTLVDEQINHYQPIQIVFEAWEVNKLLGVNFKKMFMKEALVKIGCQVHTLDHREWEVENGKVYVEPPSWRHDIKTAPDLAEEIMRMKGYSALTPDLPQIPLSGTEPEETYQYESRIRNFMVRCGGVEHRGSCFTDEKSIVDLYGSVPPEALRVKNPDIREQAFLVPTLLASLIKVVSHNRRHNRLKLPIIFEVARIYGISNSSPKHYAYIHQRNGNIVYETRRLGCIYSLSNSTVQPAIQNESTLSANLFATLKGVIEQLFKHLKVASWQFEYLQNSDSLPFAENTLTIKVDNIYVGYICHLRKSVCDSFDLEEDITYSELDLDALLPITPKRFSIKPISSYPNIIRDLALIVPLDISAEKVLSAINDINYEYLSDVRPFDQYLGKNIVHPLAPARSLAIQFTFQSYTKTLESTDIDDFIYQVLYQLWNKYKVILRDWDKLKPEDMFADTQKWLDIVKLYQSI